MRIADRSGDLCPLWNRFYNWMFIEELQEKSTRKAERMLQFATNVAFCDGFARPVQSLDRSYFFNLRCRVARLIPKAWAACVMLLSATSRAWTSACRSTSASGRIAVGGEPSLPTAMTGDNWGGRLPACSTTSVSSSTARSMAFSSSRTLPGQSYWINRRKAAVEVPLIDLSARSACLSRIGNGGAIEGYKRPLLARAGVVNRLGHQFLAGAALAALTHRDIAFGGLLHQRVHLPHSGAGAH